LSKLIQASEDNICRDKGRWLRKKSYKGVHIIIYVKMKGMANKKNSYILRKDKINFYILRKDKMRFMGT
jgi:hypothetical protein